MSNYVYKNVQLLSNFQQYAESVNLHTLQEEDSFVDLEVGYRTCLDTGAERNLIRPRSVNLTDDQPRVNIGLNLAGGSGDQGQLFKSGEVRKVGGTGVYDQLIAVGRAVMRGASFLYTPQKCE